MDNKKTCFVLMPFSNDFKNQWELAISPAIKEAGILPYRGDDENLGTNIIMHDITKRIYEAEIIIADITGKNPNVMYELGLAHAAKKDVIMLFQTDDDIPFDIRHIRYLQYDVKDLSSLKNDLHERIISTLSSENSDLDLFPELRLFNTDEFQELEYLRQESPILSIEVEPHHADVFFNNKLIGTSPLNIRINPNIERNTISVAAPGCIEYHEDITDKNIAERKISIILEKRSKGTDETKRVPRWLRYRRRDPNNPVLMRAIIQYLIKIEEYDEALSEVEELLNIAPNWCLAHNQAGFVKEKVSNGDALFHYKKASTINPNNYIGFYNLACIYSIKKDFQKTLDNLHSIHNSSARLDSFSQGNVDIFEDSDFESIKKDPIYSLEFELIAKKLMRHREGSIR